LENQEKLLISNAFFAKLLENKLNLVRDKLRDYL